MAVCGPQEQHCFKTYYKVGPKKGGGRKYSMIPFILQNKMKESKSW